MSTVLLDSHVVHWASAEPERLSPAAARAVGEAEQLAVASVTWYELAWLALNGRIVPQRPVGRWLDDLSWSLISVPLTPAVALAACSLPRRFAGDPADRQIYATAANLGCPLVSKDSRLRDYDAGDVEVVW